jgi:DNA processing protein
MNHESVLWLRLWHLRNLGYKQKCKLVHELGGAEAVFAATKSQITEVLEDADAAGVVIESSGEDEFASDLNWLKGDNHWLIPITDPAYPARLKEIADPPLVLYVHGDPKLLCAHQLAMVGSRNPTPLGRETAFDFTASLVHRGFAITSGMALGIDAAAHQGALSAQGITIAVAATGLDIVYPRTNRNLAEDIAGNGAIISEFAIGTPPRRDNFPRRNRIISGLAVGTLVVEAAARSGSLITARLAGEQGREVFAIPGSIHSTNARGCHQ